MNRRDLEEARQRLTDKLAAGIVSQALTNAVQTGTEIPGRAAEAVVKAPSIAGQLMAGSLFAEDADDIYRATRSKEKAYLAPGAGMLVGSIGGSLLGRMASRALSGRSAVPNDGYFTPGDYLGSAIGGSIGGAIGRYMMTHAGNGYAPILTGALLGAGLGGYKGYTTAGNELNKGGAVLFGGSAGALAGGVGGWLLHKAFED